jgi:hypothetical protein
MALTYLQFTNRVLKRITQSEISEVTTATGQALIITELINEAQNELWSETTNWYTLYTTRTFATVADTAEYAQASDWGRTIDMMDTTNGNMINEDTSRTFDESDPDADYTGNPLRFSVQGSNFRLDPIPAGAYTIRERYWAFPTALAANSDTSDLPLFCENFIIHWSWMSMLEKLNKFDAADRIRLKIYGNPSLQNDPGILHRCRSANNKILDRMHIFGEKRMVDGIAIPKFPSGYGPRYF